MSSSVTARFPALASSESSATAARTVSDAVGASEVSDETLMALICQGERDALGPLFRRYARVVRGIAYRVLRDAAEADDLLQEIFLLIHRLCQTFDPTKASARLWILQMTYRRAISRRRHLVSRHFYNTLDLDEVTESENDGAIRVAPPEEQLIARDTLMEILPELSEDQQRTLRLYFYDGYTFDEIAAKLGQTVGNISNHYYRGLEKLRRRIFHGKLWGKRAI